MLYCDKCAKEKGKAKLVIRKRGQYCHYCDQKRVCNDDQQKPAPTYESVLRSFCEPLLQLLYPHVVRIQVTTQAFGSCTLQWVDTLEAWCLVLGNRPAYDQRITHAQAMSHAGPSQQCYTFSYVTNEVVEWHLARLEKRTLPLESTFSNGNQPT